MYSAVLFIHVMATLCLVAAISVEAIALRQLRRTAEKADVPSWFHQMQRMRMVATVCVLILFFSGGYLTDSLSMWKLAWPKAAVAVGVAFGALAGISGRRVGRIRKALQHAVDANEVLAAVNAPFLRISLALRIGLVLAVFLMAVKPNFMQSAGAVLTFILTFWIVGAVAARKKPHEGTAAKKLEPSAT